MAFMHYNELMVVLSCEERANMDKKLAEAINKQIAAEFYSGYLYLQMAAWFEQQNLKGFAHWMRIQATEESCHGLIMFNYMIERGEAVALGKIEAPGTEYASVIDVLEKTLKHEQGVTAAINRIVNMAVEAKDHATRITFEWFITEQVEEEASASELLEKAKLVGEKPSPAIMMMDSALARREFHTPSPLKG